jgi:hypothetical protein
MSPFHPCSLRPGQLLEVEVVQPDGGRALVVGKLDAVPKVAGGCAMRIVVWDARVAALEATRDSLSAKVATLKQQPADRERLPEHR